ncbi:MAG: TM2 domain-containing protein, partial [Cyclobacteriaceae bacterium]|nr:TM2 domain-containing protein [Cyclobacteriaceae bacterium]
NKYPMKKTLNLALVLTLFASVGAFASVDSYRINDSAVEAVFNSSTTVSADAFSLNNSFGTLSTTAASEKDALAAMLINFFVGGLGIHRVYLGGSGMLVFGYIITGCGILGIVPFIDLIVLAINYDDISKYVNNDKFFMW